MADRLRVAIVDDDDGWAKLAHRALVTSFDLDRATSVAELLKVAHVATPQVVLLDLRLPDGGDYLSLVMKICARFPQSAVIVTTGVDDEDLALETLRAGAQDYIVKEVSIWKTMPGKIRSAYARKRAAIQQVVQAAESSMAAPIVDAERMAAQLEARLAKVFKVRTDVHETVPPGQWWRRVTIGAVYDLTKRNGRFLLGLLAAAAALLGVRESTEDTGRSLDEVERRAGELEETVHRIERLLQNGGSRE